MQNKILLVQCYAAGKIGSNALFRSPSEAKYLNKLNSKFDTLKIDSN